MSERATMNISLPKSMKAWVEARVEAEGYGTASEYFRNLVRLEQNKQARKDLEAHLLKSLDSGPSRPFAAEDWEEIRKKIHGRLASPRRKKAG